MTWNWISNKLQKALVRFYVGRDYLEPEKHISGVASIPDYVDTAFACELCMKAIIVFHNPNITK